MNENRTYKFCLIITDYTRGGMVDVTKKFAASPVFTDFESCYQYAMGRGHHPQTCTAEDMEGVKVKRLIEYDIIDSDGNRMYIPWA